jgi:hypothetical protein
LLWWRSVLVTDDSYRIGGFAETDFDDLGVHRAEAVVMPVDYVKRY